MPAQGLQGIAEVIERVRIVRPQLQGPAEARRGFLVPAQGREGGAEAVVGLGKVRMRIGRTLETGRGLSGSAQVLEDIAQADVGVREPGRGFQGAAGHMLPIRCGDRGHGARR